MKITFSPGDLIAYGIVRVEKRGGYGAGRGKSRYSKIESAFLTTVKEVTRTIIVTECGYRFRRSTLEQIGGLMRCWVPDERTLEKVRETSGQGH